MLGIPELDFYLVVSLIELANWPMLVDKSALLDQIANWIGN
ncbi:hypothetical protein [Lactococcus lactis]